MRRLLALCALLAMAACAPQRVVVTPDLRPALDRAALEALGEPVALLEVPALGAAALMRVSARNGPVTTWSTVDARALSLEDGILVATRGLGHDLMSAEPGRARARLARGGADWAPRFYSWLDGEDQPIFATLLCHIEARRPGRLEILGRARQVTRVTERCTNPDHRVTNTYWLGADGVIWKSHQWASPDLGYVEIERLIR
jgi:hypothetical protein